MVWRKQHGWLLRTECERYEIRKFVTGEQITLASTRGYRLFRQTDYWREFAPPERNLTVAKAACEEDLNATLDAK